MQTLTPAEYNTKYGDKGAWTPSSTNSLGRSTIAQAQDPNLFQRVANTVKNAGAKEADIFMQKDNQDTSVNSIPRKATEAVATAFNTIPQVAVDVLPKPARQAVGFVGDKAGQALSWLGDKLGSVQLAQDFVTKHPDAANALGEITATASNLGQTAGDILTADQGVKGAQKTVDAIKTGAEKTGEIISTRGAQVKNAYDSIKENVTNYPKQIADRVTMGKIDPKTQTILQEIPASTFDKYVQQGQKALTDPRELTPLETAGNQAEDVATQLKAGLKTIGQKKSDVLDSVKTARVPNIATDQIDKIKPLLQTKLTDSERSLVNQYVDELKTLGKNPTAKSVDGTIDKLQATLYEKSKGVAVPTTPRIQSAINRSIGELNSNLKSTVDAALEKSGSSASYSELNALYAERVNTFNQLNKLLGEGGTKGGSLMKRFFSPQDSGIKELFATIKSNYGVDLGAEATIAKFVMDTLGDTRARSLLQLPPITKFGLAGKALNYAEQKLTSPKKVLQKARTLAKP